MKQEQFGMTTRLGKILLFSLNGVTLVILCFLLFLYSSERLWPEFNGSYNLGKGIYMIEWDGGKLIVKGSNIKGHTCYGGERIIPSCENQYDSIGNLVEYVVDARFNDNWIIAKTNNKLTKRVKYYIIKKGEGIENVAADKIQEKYTLSFTDSIEFKDVCQKAGITLKW